MQSLKRGFALVICLVLVLALTACEGALTIKPYDIPEMSRLDNGVVAENATYRLSWDGYQACVLLENKNSGRIWSTVPYDFYETEDWNVDLNSPIFIEYYNPSDGSLLPSKASMDVVEEDRLSVEKTENGVKLSCYFADAEITVPLYLTLRDDSLQASVPLAEVVESGKTELVSVSVLPGLCAAINNVQIAEDEDTDEEEGEEGKTPETPDTPETPADPKENYLLIPTGSGALLYTDEEAQNVSRTYTGKVFGKDATRMELDSFAVEEAVRLPIYGAKNGNDALLAIIENGEGAASICADAGNRKSHHSSAYATFAVRGSDIVEVERNNNSDESVYVKYFNKDAVYTVGYYPLEDDKADYNGMAQCYRGYLERNGMLQKTEQAQQDYHVQLLGGATTKQFFLGFPYHSLTTATTFDDAKTILDGLKAIGTPAVTLNGFGDGGITPNEIGGGFSFASALGGKGGYKDLAAFCEENGIPLSADFDLVRYSESGSGFNSLFDTAKTASMQSAISYPLKASTRLPNEDGLKTRLLKRGKLDKAVEKLLDFTDGLVGGVGLATLGNTAYSDYSEDQYFLSGNTAQFTAFLKSVKEKGHTLALSAANGYAAGVADSVSDAPLQNGGYIAFDETVPFYEMVFAGYTALYTTPVNESPDANALILRAMEAGVSPSFTVYAAYDEDLAADDSKAFYAGLYESVKPDIEATVKATSACLAKIKGQAIARHDIIADGVTCTAFANGAKVYVNRTQETFTAEDGTAVPAGQFVCR